MTDNKAFHCPRAEQLAALRDYLTSKIEEARAVADGGNFEPLAVAEDALREAVNALHDDALAGASRPDRERFAAAINEARAWMQAHRGGEWVGWSCAVLTGSQEVTSPGWYALPPGQWVSEPAILIDHATRDGLELPTVEQAVERWGVPVKAEE